MSGTRGRPFAGQGTYDPSGIQALASALTGKAGLTELTLSYNNLGAEGAKALADALKSGKAVLTSLNLASNRIGVEGAKALASALKSGRAVLTTLNLSNNRLCGIWYNYKGQQGTYDPSGIQALASALAGTSVLTKLDASWNGLGDEGKKVLRDAAEGREGFQLRL